MRRLCVVFIPMLFILVTSAAFADGWKRAYFVATPQGSWARYDETTPEMKMTTTNTRLPDEDGQARVSSVIEFANDQYPRVTNEYTLQKGFSLDRELIDYLAQISGGRVGSGEGGMQSLDGATLAAISKSYSPYGARVAFKASETVDQRKCDRYSYTTRHPGQPATVESGDLWLSPEVPFGVVKQTSTTRDAAGKIVTTYSRSLVAAGTTASAAPPRAATTVAAAAPARYTLAAAYQKGLIAIKAEVASDAKEGDRVHLLIETKEQSFTLIVPKGKTSLHVDVPLDDFQFEVQEAKTFEMTGDQAAELDVRQIGQKRALEGRFTITVYEGSPLFSGSATVGWVKK